MQKQPLFSVIMPNFNNSEYIKEAIESVIVQKYSNWELVIVDDASTDNSLDVIEPFLSNPKIILIKNTANKGVAFVAKQAVENSSGEIIGTLDSDDLLDEDALSVMVEQHIVNPACGLIYSNHYLCNEDGSIRSQANWLDQWKEDTCLQEVLISKVSESITISMHFRTFKKSSYDKTAGYDTFLLSYEDRDLYYKLEKVTNIRGINKCLYHYRQNSKLGAFRNNPMTQYYWFVCEYKETKRRLGVNLPFASKKTISPFLSNIMYMHLRNYPNINRSNLRVKLHSLFLVMGNNNLQKNKLLAFFFFLNSLAYGHIPLTFNRLKKFMNPELMGK